MKNEQPSLELKALRVIQTLAEDYCLSQGRVENHPKDCKFCYIFQMAHTAASPDCNKNHPGWLEELEEVYNRFEKE